MEDKKKKFASGVNVGSSSILVTFVLLCLVTFAALSFVSANADYKLARKTADRISNYYSANSIAEVYLSNVDADLSKHFSMVGSSDEYFSEIEECFANNDTISVYRDDENNVYLTYNINVSDSQDLNVTLKAVYPETMDEDMFEIINWETVSTFVYEEPTIEEETGSFLF